MPEIKSLYQWLEVDFHPLKLCKNVAGITEFLSGNEELKTYVNPLQDIAVAKLLNQVLTKLFLLKHSEIFSPLY